MKAIPATLLSLSLIVLATCGGDDDGDDPADSVRQDAETETTADDGRRQGGELTITTSFPVASLDPHLPVEVGDLTAARMAWRGLYSLDNENNVVAETDGIADGLPEVSADGTTVTVKMKEELKWSDGNDLRAEDFVAAFIRTCNPVLAAGFQYLLANIVGCDDFFFADRASADLDQLQSAVGVTALDELTIQFELGAPQPTFPAILTLWVSYPVPVHLERFASATPAEPADWGLEPTELAYNGPYQVVSFDQDVLTLEPNPNWAGATRPSLDRLNVRGSDDPFTLSHVEGFRRGETDAVNITFLSAQEGVIDQLAAEFGDEYFRNALPQTRSLLPRLGNEALRSQDVRLALVRAIDRDALNEAISGGLNQPTTSFVPENTSGVAIGSYDDVAGYDPEAARSHLAAAGYPDGVGFPGLTILARDDRDSAIAEFLRQSYLSELNIEVRAEVVDFQTRDQRISAGQFDLAVVGWVADYPDPENWILGLFNTGGVFNFGGCSDAELDATIEDASLNRDNEERRELYREAERLVLEQACVIPFWHETRHVLIGGDVVGMREKSSDSSLEFPGDDVPEAWGLRAQ